VSKKLSADRVSRDWLDLIALVAVLATAILLAVLAHMTAGSLVTVCGALVTLYGAWSRFGPVRQGRHIPSVDVSQEDEGEVDP
jgi:hypothetical protein